MLGTCALVVHVLEPYNYICRKHRGSCVFSICEYFTWVYDLQYFVGEHILYMHAMFALFLHICQNEIASRETLERDWSSKLSSTQQLGL